MRSQLSISIFNHSNYSRRYFTFSRTLLILCCFTAFSAMIVVGYFFLQARLLEMAIHEPAVLDHQIALKQQQIKIREKQISLLKEKLNTISTRLGRLEKSERKIRDIARIEPAINYDNLFGIGGTKNKSTEPEESAETDTDYTFDDTFNPNPIGEIIYRTLSNQAAGFTLLFEPTDFSINPVAGLPALLPADKDTEYNRHESHEVAVGIMECRRGVSLSTKSDSFIMAPSRGVVVYAGKNSSSEKILIIDHGHGFMTRYTGFDRISIKPGDQVYRGDKLGLIKAATETKPSHPFYFEILLNGLAVNPEKYLSQGSFLL